MVKNIIFAIVLLALLTASAVVFGKAFGLLGVLGVVAVFILICLTIFFRMMRLLKTINASPEGKLSNAEAFHAQIAVGMPLIKIVQIAEALGKRVQETPPTYVWQDDTQQVIVTFNGQNAEQIEMVQLPESQSN